MNNLMNERAWFWMTRLSAAFVASVLMIVYLTNSKATAVHVTQIVSDNSCLISNAGNLTTHLAAHCIMNKDREVVISATFNGDKNVSNTYIQISAYNANLNLLWRDILRVCTTEGFEHHHDLADAELTPCISDTEKQLALNIYAPPDVQRLNVRYDPLFFFDADL